MRGRIIVVDDDELLLGFMVEHLSLTGYETKAFSSPIECKDYLNNTDSKKIDLIISDVKMNEMTGDELHSFIDKNHPHIGIILMTGFGNINHAVNAMRKGAFDYVTKPFNAKEISLRVKQFFEKKDKIKQPKLLKNSANISISQNGTAGSKDSLNQQNNETDKKFVGQDPSVTRLLNIIPIIAENDAPVLIQGESGTGKEVFAKQIQSYSKRANKPYIKINCANLPTELVESTLFGHVKGSFTGAVSDRNGAFDEAHGGTLLLDEITEINITVQAKLLRVLQEKEYTRVGSQKPIETNVRILATTNRNIIKSINDGLFREDLYYRINVFPIKIPSLKERKSDIPLLVNHFIELYTSKYQLNNKVICDKLLGELMNYEWRGNVRELENMIHRGVILSGNSDVIEKEHIENSLFSNLSDELGMEALSDVPLISIEEMELQLIKKAMEHTRGNQKKAAEILGITDRTIRNKLKNIQF